MAARVGLDQNSVVRAAAEIADGEGLAALTLAHLAERLGVRYQSLYSHVNTPAELLGHLQALYLREVGDVTRRAAVGKAGRDALVAIAVAQLEYDLQHPGLSAVHWQLGVREPDMLLLMADATSALTTVLRSYGLRGEELVHWRRAVATTVAGFGSIQSAGLLCLAPDTRTTFMLLIDTLADALDQQVRRRRRKGA